MQWFKTILFFLYYFNLANALTKTCTGHDGCKGEEWIGSYTVTCSGGERICHNTVLKCGRESCKIIVKGSGHDAYQNSIVYAQNIKTGGTFELNCKASGQRKCKNNFIYCPREIGTECICKNCDSTTTMYYKYGTKYTTGGATAKRYWDGPIICDGKAVCDIDERTDDTDYTTVASYLYLYKYPSNSYNYDLYTDINGNTIDFSYMIGEYYKSWSYISRPGQTPSYTYEVVNYTDKYGTYGRICRRRKYNDVFKYYHYKPHCNKYKYGDPYEGFWVLGEPAQSCTDACLLHNMTCDKQPAFKTFTRIRHRT